MIRFWSNVFQSEFFCLGSQHTSVCASVVMVLVVAVVIRLRRCQSHLHHEGFMRLLRANHCVCVLHLLLFAHLSSLDFFLDFRSNGKWWGRWPWPNKSYRRSLRLRTFEYFLFSLPNFVQFSFFLSLTFFNLQLGFHFLSSNSLLLPRQARICVVFSLDLFLFAGFISALFLLLFLVKETRSTVSTLPIPSFIIFHSRFS